MDYTVEYEAANGHGGTVTRTKHYQDTPDHTWEVFVGHGGQLVVQMIHNGTSIVIPGSKMVYGPGRWMNYAEEAWKK